MSGINTKQSLLESSQLQETTDLMEQRKKFEEEKALFLAKMKSICALDDHSSKTIEQLDAETIIYLMEQRKKFEEDQVAFLDQINSICELMTHNHLSKAIELLNSIDNETYDKYPCPALPIEQCAEKIVAFLANYANPKVLLEKSWFKECILTPKISPEMMKVKNAKTTDFHEIAEAASQISTLNKTAHLFGSFITECKYQGHSFPLEGSADNTFDPIFDSIPNQIKDSAQNIPSYEVVTIFDQWETMGGHFSALTTCHSDEHGNFIAFGNVGGGAEYVGVQIYRLKENDKKVQEEVLENIKKSSKNLLRHETYLQMVEQLKGELVVEIPALEQLHGYCGLKSGAELNHISRSFFMEMLKEPKTIGPLDANHLNKIASIAKKSHIEIMNKARELIGFQMLNELSQSSDLIKLKPEFFQDLYAQTKRYGLSDEFKCALEKYMKSKNIPLDFPLGCYQDYLYERHNKPDIYSAEEKQMNAWIEKYHQLHNDYDENGLLELSTLDDTLFKKENAEEDNLQYALTVDEQTQPAPELNQAHPVQKKYIINMYDQLVHEQNQAFAIQVLPQEIETATLHNPVSFSKITYS